MVKLNGQIKKLPPLYLDDLIIIQIFTAKKDKKKKGDFGRYKSVDFLESVLILRENICNRRSYISTFHFPLDKANLAFPDKQLLVTCHHQRSKAQLF